MIVDLSFKKKFFFNYLSLLKKIKLLIESNTD